MTDRAPIIPRTAWDWAACLAVTALLSMLPLAYLFTP